MLWYVGFGDIPANTRRSRLEKIKSTLQKMTPMWFWWSLTSQMSYFQKQVSTSEVPLGKPGIQDGVQNGRHKWGGWLTWLIRGTNCLVIPLFKFKV